MRAACAPARAPRVHRTRTTEQARRVVPRPEAVLALRAHRMHTASHAIACTRHAHCMSLDARTVCRWRSRRSLAPPPPLPLTRWPEAIEAFHEAEEADPDFPETHFNQAHVLLAAERLEEAGGQLHAAERLRFDPARSAAKREELQEALAARAARRRRQERVAAQEKRDGHLSKEQRQERMQQVIGHCGAGDKQCMREMLGQAEGATEEDAVRF
jgi:tetratricopeptide (TPR) repeat protein